MFTKQLQISAYTLIDQLMHLSHSEFQKLCDFSIPAKYKLEINNKIKIDVSNNEITFRLKIISNNKKIKCTFVSVDNICKILKRT